ncbi:MAG: hypothetical protein U9Q69_04260 [Nanoarchaeota archaeon]|nr:hypothetical protein [Nanoarchaeota archaeon]
MNTEKRLKQLLKDKISSRNELEEALSLTSEGFEYHYNISKELLKTIMIYAMNGGNRLNIEVNEKNYVVDPIDIFGFEPECFHYLKDAKAEGIEGLRELAVSILKDYLNTQFGKPAERTIKVLGDNKPVMALNQIKEGVYFVKWKPAYLLPE